jgi:predicted transposase/invertase (TIGR01784 family)
MTETPIDILSPKNDFVFKQLFGDAQHTAPLAALLQATLGLPAEEFVGLAVADPNLNREYGDDKLCVLDVRITTRSGRDVDVEIQVRPSDELCDRIQCYVARMVTEKVKLGGSYKVPQSISIVITDHVLWEGDGRRYHHHFRLFDSNAGLPYPNSMEIHTLELPKIPKDSDGTTLWRWLKFISSETRDEFESLAGKDTVMAEALLKLMAMSMDLPTRRAAENRAKWLWDEDARMRKSRREGEAEGEARGRKEEKAGFILRLLQMNMPFAEIAKAADCPLSDVERLAAEMK